MSLESYGVDRVRLLWKIPMWLCGTNFWTSLAFFALSVVTQPNYPKCTQIEWNTPKHEFRSLRGQSGVFVSKNSETTSWHELLHYFGPFCTEFCKATKQSQMHQIVQNTPKYEFRIQWGWIECIHCEKFWRDFVARTFAPAWPVLHWVL